MEGQHERLTRWALRVWLTIGLLVLVGLLWWLLRKPLGLVAPPVAIAVVLVYVLNPSVSALARRGVPRALAALVAYVAAGALLWGVLSIVGPLVVEQARGLVDELPEIAASLQTWVNGQLTRFGVPPSQQLDLETTSVAVAIQDWIAENRDEVVALLRARPAHSPRRTVSEPAVRAWSFTSSVPCRTSTVCAVAPPGCCRRRTGPRSSRCRAASAASWARTSGASCSSPCSSARPRRSA